MSFGRGLNVDPPSRAEHNDLKERVRIIESKLDRITWLVIATLASALVDLARNWH